MNPSGDVLIGSRHNTYLLIWIQSIQEGMVQIIGPWCKTKVMAFLKAKLTGSRMQCACVSNFSYWLNSRCRLISHDVWHCFPKVVQELLHRLQLTTHQLCTIYCKALDIAFPRQSAGRTSHSHACVALGWNELVFIWTFKALLNGVFIFRQSAWDKKKCRQLQVIPWLHLCICGKPHLPPRPWLGREKKAWCWCRELHKVTCMEPFVLKLAKDVSEMFFWGWCFWDARTWGCCERIASQHHRLQQCQGSQVELTSG